MRMSCNGCRVLRKGCSESCSIRPCLEWIKTPESQANATVFLAKFYGRAGLVNLINAGPQHLRPAIFKSLLHEACGRIVNPIYGSVGLLWSGSWQLCQNAVESVLNGDPITQIATDAAETKNGPPLKSCDIRHVVNREDNLSGSNDLKRVRTRCRFKRSGAKSKRSRARVGLVDKLVERSPSHGSSLSHQSESAHELNVEASAETMEPAGHGAGAGTEPDMGSARCEGQQADSREIELDLTLGLEPFKRCFKPMESRQWKGVDWDEEDNSTGVCKMELGGGDL